MQATGSSSSAWGGRRAAAGHPSPYTLQAFAIGNEDCRVKGYAPNFVTIAKAVRAAYPKLPLILGCEEQDQMKDMVSRATNSARCQSRQSSCRRDTFSRESL